MRAQLVRQDLLHLHLLVGRPEVGAPQPASQVADLGHELRSVADAVLAAGDAEVDEVHLQVHQLLIQIGAGLLDAGIIDDPGQRFDLAPRDLDPVHRVRRVVQIAAQVEEHARLRLDVGLGAARVRIFPDDERLGLILPTDRELHGVRAGPREDAERPGAWRRPAVWARHDVRGVHRARAHPHFPGRLVAQIPLHAVEARLLPAPERPDDLALRVENLDSHLSGSVRLQPDLSRSVRLSWAALQRGQPDGVEVVVDRRAVWRVPADRRVGVRRGRGCDRPEPVGRPHREEVRVRRLHLRRDLLQRRDVVHDPEAAAVGRDHQVVEVLLHDDAGHRRVRQIVLQRQPALSIVERHEDGVLEAEVQQAPPHRVLADDLRVA